MQSEAGALGDSHGSMAQVMGLSVASSNSGLEEIIPPGGGNEPMAKRVSGQQETPSVGDAALMNAAAFANATHLPLLSMATAGVIEFVNDAALQLFGYRRDELVGQSVLLIVPERLREECHYNLTRMMDVSTGILSGKIFEILACDRNGREFPLEVTLTAWDADGDRHLGMAVADISERHRRQARLTRLKDQASLTGLHNSHGFQELLGERCESGHVGALLMLDIDGLRDIRDHLGTQVHETLIRSIIVRISLPLGLHTALAQLAANRFAILLPQQARGDTTPHLAGQLLEALAVPFMINGHRLRVIGSIGYALASDEVDAEELVAQADFALLHAKRSDTQKALAFDASLQAVAQNRRAVQRDLLRALTKREFVLQYQPQVNLRNGSLCGMEALIRWQHPERGLLPPGEFLPMLEQSALSVDVGWWVLDEALRQLSEWAAAGLPLVKMSVNLFPSQIRCADLAAEVADLLHRYHIDPAWLELEITETATLQDGDQSFKVISELRDLGVGIAFDDFGTGYASLGTLQRYPITTLKIDRGFVRDLITKQRDAAITRALIMLSKDIGVTTIAEGIETAEQEITLKIMGCDCGQGYLYGRSMPPSEIAAQLSRLLPQPAQPVARAS
ncbi:putative bifunctional diguanylate cyclase/phosphodiesterase [Rhizobium sp. SGZ-381]|uniref:putative bifunctional diguanylate cyclase/phosphodiesterase n=1 Tax=Rhizobium sp. SGZ-381 TaxID=3342800 RepID=UPI00366C82C6